MGIFTQPQAQQPVTRSRIDLSSTIDQSARELNDLYNKASQVSSRSSNIPPYALKAILQCIETTMGQERIKATGSVHNINNFHNKFADIRNAAKAEEAKASESKAGVNTPKLSG